MGSGTTVTTVLFDAGGTLIHLDYFFLYQELRRAGIRVTPWAVRRAECASKSTIDRRMLEVRDTDETRRQPYFTALLDRLGVDTDTALRLIEHFDAIHVQDNLWRVMLPSTPQVLVRLRERGLTLGVISNSDGRVTTILERCGIARFFHLVIDSHHVGCEKPDPRIFHLALAQAGAQPTQAIFVGDIYSIDVVGAQRAGLRPVLFDMVGCYTGVTCEKIRHLRALLSIV